MNIALVMTIDFLNTKKCGGVISYVRTLAKYLTLSGNTVHIITFSNEDYSRQENNIWIHAIQHPNLHYYFHRIFKKSVGLSRAMKDVECSWVIRQKLRRLVSLHGIAIVEYPDTWAESLFHPNSLLASVVKLHGPYFLWQRLYGYHESFGYRIHNYITKRAVSTACALAAPSFFLKSKIEEIFARHVELIPNPIDFDIFFPKRRNAGSLPVRVIMTGRLGDEQKGATILFDAMEKVINKTTDIEFVFAGSDDLPRWVKEKFGHRVMFLGCLSPESLAEAYRRSDFTVVPSITWENFSYACAEAMACGIPVIASNVGAIPELVSEGNTGLLFKEESADELAEKIVTLSRNKELLNFMGKNAYEKICEICQPLKVAANTLAFYRQVVDRGCV